MARKTRSYVLCVHAEGDVDLENRKLYEVLADEQAAVDGYIRVVDESGEDYLYPARFFVPLPLPRAAERALAGPGKGAIMSKSRSTVAR